MMKHNQSSMNRAEDVVVIGDCRHNDSLERHMALTMTTA